MFKFEVFSNVMKSQLREQLTTKWFAFAPKFIFLILFMRL